MAVRLALVPVDTELAELTCDLLSAGHYVGWSAATPSGENGEAVYDVDPDKTEWYKFDDEKVSLVSKDKILALEGGGTFWPHCSTRLRNRN